MVKIVDEKFKDEYLMLENNKELREKVKMYLIENGVPCLKGLEYFTDIVVIALIKRKYSLTFMKEIYPFIAHKYKIKSSSVQRQIRYTFTIHDRLRFKPNKIYQKIWSKFQIELQKEREKIENENQKN